MHEDAHWVHQTLKGDEKAFHRLIHKYHRSIYAQILVRVRNRWDAEELTNDVFLKAFRRLDSLKEPSRFGAWLSQIAQHHATDWLRQEAVARMSLQAVARMSLEEVIGEDAAVVTECLTTETGVEQRLLRKGAYHQVLAAMHCLSAKERMLMEAFYVEDVPYQTLQERYHLSRSSVKKHLHEARQKVRERLEKLYGGIVAIPWWKIGKQTLKGGLEVVKLGVKAKAGIGGVAVLLALGGAVVWYASQPIGTEEEMDAVVEQAKQTSPGFSPSTSVAKVDAPVKSETATLGPVEDERTVTEPELADTVTSPLEAPQETVVAVSEPPAEPHEPRCMGLTRAEMEVEVRELEGVVRTKLTRIVSLYNEVIELCESGEVANPEIQAWAKQATQEHRRLWEELNRPTADDPRSAPLHRYVFYTVALGGEDPTAPGGWIYEMQQATTYRSRVEIYSIAWEE